MQCKLTRHTAARADADPRSRAAANALASGHPSATMLHQRIAGRAAPRPCSPTNQVSSVSTHLIPRCAGSKPIKWRRCSMATRRPADHALPVFRECEQPPVAATRNLRQRRTREPGSRRSLYEVNHGEARSTTVCTCSVRNLKGHPIFDVDIMAQYSQFTTLNRIKYSY